MPRQRLVFALKLCFAAFFVASIAGFVYEQIGQRRDRLSTRGRQVIVVKSGHGIPEEAPEDIVAAIQEVLVNSRTRQF